MIDVTLLRQVYELHPPADSADIAAAQEDLGKAIPPAYVELLTISNGLSAIGGLTLLETEDIAQRNRDYEVAEYLPDYVMIGDDSGGAAILMKQGAETIFEVDMGVMDESDIEVSAKSLEELLVDFAGKTLRERR
ncbi:MAG: SMI1/KNR4 family protein [Paracoccus aminovorans]|nr:SMI1/KNR4 family protein [Paracoccus aminovorans]